MIGIMCGWHAAGGAAPAEPVQLLDRTPIAAPVDHRFTGAIAIHVDATDIAHKLFRVTVRIPIQRDGSGQQARLLTLLYPRWEAASHGPSLSVTDLAGLTIEADGQPVTWRRDAIEPHAFHLDLPAGARQIEARYQIVADGDLLAPDAVVVPWQRLILYPAGWYARNLTIAPVLTLPPGLQPITSLAIETVQGGIVRFAPASLEAVLDAPVTAARHVARLALSSDPAVTIDLIAERPQGLTIAPAQIDAFRRMVAQTIAVFGPAPFRRYDIVLHMHDDASTGGTEHRRSSEIAAPPTYFSAWDEQLNNRDIVPHEFVHAWNGLYRTPADLWAATPNEPQGGSLLWAYEGQTEFWGRLLAARAGLRSRDDTIDRLAIDAAEVANRPGRAWRPLSDDVTYPTFMLRQRVPWRDWQRRKDYYGEGIMLWLAVDARLRERSGGRRGIDDFAHLFFAGASADAPTRTYVFADMCAALSALAPDDWAGFLHQWIDGHQALDTTDGLTRHGWRLVYSDVPSASFRQTEAEAGAADLSYSIGLTVADNGAVRAVAWNGPAFAAGLAPGARIVAIADAPFSADRLRAAVRDAAQQAVRLTVEQDGTRRSATIAYRGTLRYPHLTRIPGRPDGLSPLLAPR